MPKAAEQVFIQFKRYWAVVVATAGIMLYLHNAFSTLDRRLTSLETSVAINVNTLNAFANQGPRFTLQQGNELERRITILEQYHKDD